MTSVFIFAGETSGDLHGGQLIQALQQRIPNLSIDGVGGPEMRLQGMECLMPMENFQVMGFTDVILAFPKLYRYFFQIRDHILKTQPKAVILIDYPGFNIRLAKALRKSQYKGKIIQYICPTVWAWGKHRIQTMAQTLDLLLTVYPFEVECFSKTNLSVKYIGNPIAEVIQQHNYQSDWKQESSLSSSKNFISIFPGSRKQEIYRNFPKQLQAAAKLRGDFVFGVSVAHDEMLPIIQEIVKKSSLKMNHDLFCIPKKFRYEMMKECSMAIAKSGTITLELALHEKPTVVVYELTRLNRFIAKYLLRLNLPHYCIVNILLNQTVYPELIASGFSPEVLVNYLKMFKSSPSYRDACIEACREVKKVLQHHRPSQQAALAIEEVLSPCAH